MTLDHAKDVDRYATTVRIEGLVQGVGFRMFVAREATALDLNGFVRNRRDGGVEAVFEGSHAAIETMLAHCRRGPRGARVDFMKVLDAPASLACGFVIRATV